jgi:EAL domain-containing protein (putative c-di-GMP-specific phosphodiesterase class I)
VAQTIATLGQLAAMGIRLSIDDFGTGYSSLSSLQKFPIHALKIDKSFVQDLVANANDQALSRAIIGLAHSLGLAVIAEGIEGEAQLECLRGMGCESGQGHFFSPPVGSSQAEAMLAAHSSSNIQRTGPPGPSRQGMNSCTS